MCIVFMPKQICYNFIQPCLLILLLNKQNNKKRVRLHKLLFQHKCSTAIKYASDFPASRLGTMTTLRLGLGISAWINKLPCPPWTCQFIDPSARGPRPTGHTALAGARLGKVWEIDLIEKMWLLWWSGKMVFLPRMQYTGYLMGSKNAIKDNTISPVGTA